MPYDDGVTFEDDPFTDRDFPIVVKRDGIVIYRGARFNNGFDRDGTPLPMEYSD